MDTRTGNIYESRDAAKAHGVGDDALVSVTVADGTVTIDNGPFKGRIYDVSGGKRGRRRKDLEARRATIERIEQQLVAAQTTSVG